MTISDEKFERWLDIIIVRPDDEWTDEEAAFYKGLTAHEIAACFARIFCEPDASLASLSDEVTNEGLWTTLSLGYDFMWPLLGPEVSFDDRATIVRLIPRFFERFLAPRCDQHLSHLDRESSGGRPLNGVCYMWWDIF